MKIENKKMQDFLSTQGINGVTAKYIDAGSLKGCWRLYKKIKPGKYAPWTEQDAAELNRIGFVDFNNKPLGKLSGNGGSWQVFARGHNELLQNNPPASNEKSEKHKIADFVGKSQAAAIRDAILGEEGKYFTEKMQALQALINSMPITGDTDGRGDGAIVYLHYFRGSADAWITELDKGAPDDVPEQYQAQAFGLVDFGYGPELGYINIPELLSAGMELDLYWTPKTIGDIKKEQITPETIKPAPASVAVVAPEVTAWLDPDKTIEKAGLMRIDSRADFKLENYEQQELF